MPVDFSHAVRTMHNMHITPTEHTPAKLAFAGDWHGNHQTAWQGMYQAAQMGCDVIIQLGDFGLWPGISGQRYLQQVDMYAAKTGVRVLWLDGNHEDYDQLDAAQVNMSNGMHQFGEHIWHLPRGARWSWHDVDFLVAGGATSLDRPGRTEGVSWWPGEELTEAQIATIASEGVCDVLLTHDCPAGVDIPGITHRRHDPSSSWPMSELLRAWDHRDRLAGMVEQVSPAVLYHGHFHRRYQRLARLAPDVVTYVSGLGDDEVGLHENLAVVDMQTLSEYISVRRISGGDPVGGLLPELH